MLGILVWLLVFGGIGYLIAGTTGMLVGVILVLVLLLCLLFFFGGAMVFLLAFFSTKRG